MGELIAALSVGSCLVLLTAFIHYEILRISWDVLPEVPLHPRLRVLILAIPIFGAHTISIWLYAFVYWLIEVYSDVDVLVGNYDASFEAILYFSSATYSSLGYGDIYPVGVIRMIAGIEVLNGLVLIGWSVSLTYLAMVRFWDIHRSKKK